MNTLTKRDWDRIKRPVYPNIQFISEGDKLQVQSMLGLMIDGEEYYLPLIKISQITKLEDFYRLTEEYVAIAKQLVDKYLAEKANIEEDDNVYKIVKD